eukprot:SM000029S10488  [mRNA]  locus=s29:429698:432899:+ [translate_table: standard]
MVKEGAAPARSWSEAIASRLPSDPKVVFIALGYCLSASLLAIINKWAIMVFPYAGSLTALQYVTSFTVVFVLSKLGFLEADPLDLKLMLKFLPAALMFYLSIFTCTELLLHANVDTFIVFRSAVPIFVALGETFFLKSPWPSLTTWTSLLVIVGGSITYVYNDSEFTIDAYSWGVAYLISMSVDFVLIKHIVMTIGLNTWGLVLYNNLEALIIFPLQLLITGEGNQLQADSLNTTKTDGWMSMGVILPVGLSCAFGLAISFFGFSCRRATSATAFVVLGVVNKLLTIVINLAVWTHHASTLGTLGLCVCILGGVLYQQSTVKPKAKAPIEDEKPSKS